MRIVRVVILFTAFFIKYKIKCLEYNENPQVAAINNTLNYLLSLPVKDGRDMMLEEYEFKIKGRQNDFATDVNTRIALQNNNIPLAIFKEASDDVYQTLATHG